MSERDGEIEVVDEDTAAEEASLDGGGFDVLFDTTSDEQSIKKESLTLPVIRETASRAEKSVALRQALRAMSSEESGAALSVEDLESLKTFFCALYGGSTRYRHEYSSLCTLMYELLEENEDQSVDLADALPYEINTLATNMTTVRSYLERINAEADDELPIPTDVLTSVQKLDDHIELEFQRMKYLIKQNSTLHKNVDGLTQEFQARVATTEDALTQDFKRNIQEAEARSRQGMKAVKNQFEKDVKETEARSQRNYVSVLGIFISLVISFSAGIRLSTEAVQALSAMGTYRFAAVLTIVVFGMFDLILTLLFFILLVSDIDGGAKKIIKRIGIVGNIAFAVIIAAVLIAKYLKLFG